MIITENIIINGKKFVRTYSDDGMMVERDGIRYGEAIDPSEYGRTYTETDEPVESGESETIEATIEDYENALSEFGVKI